MKFLDTQGTNMPVLGFGTWRLKGKECADAVFTALDIGYRHIDTAQMYENEAEVGRAIADSGIARNDIFVTTKVWMENAAADRVRSSTAESLAKLRLDYVDLLLLHWPSQKTPLSETLAAMSELRRAGKTKAIGVSNFPVSLMREAVEKLGHPIACNQVEYHIGLSQQPVLDYARANGIIVTAYSPLGRGELLRNSTLEKIGAKHGKTSAQVALRWLIEQPGVAAIPKAAHEKNMRLNFEIFDFELDDDDRSKIASLGGDQRLINPAWAPAWDQAA